MKKLNDNSVMSFGLHQGKKLIDVPAKYLMWLYDNNKCNPSLREYIEFNIDVIKQEIEDSENE